MEELAAVLHEASAVVALTGSEVGRREGKTLYEKAGALAASRIRLPITTTRRTPVRLGLHAGGRQASGGGDQGVQGCSCPGDHCTSVGRRSSSTRRIRARGHHFGVWRPGLGDIMTAFGTVAAATAAVSIATWSHRQAEAERRRSRLREQYTEAYSVQVVQGERPAPGEPVSESVRGGARGGRCRPGLHHHGHRGEVQLRRQEPGAPAEQ